MARLTKAERDKLPESDFGDPKRRLFPVTSQEDVDSAARLIGRARDPEAVKARIVEICKRKGLKIPDAWKADAGMAAFALVEFDAAPGGEPDGGMVTRTAKVLLRVGDYDFPPERGGPFSVTPEDILDNAAGWRPVQLEDNHRPSLDHMGAVVGPSFFDGKLGHVAALLPNDDYTEAGATVKIPRWLDALYKDRPIPLSARWDRATRRVRDVALTYKGKVPDAAMQEMAAAFAADEAATPPADGGAGKKPRHMPMTPHGQKAMQYMHDLTAMHGANCDPAASPAAKGKPGDAGFMADHESESMQKIHDLTLGSGAACAIYKGMHANDRDWKQGQYYATGVESLPAYRDYLPGRYAAMSAEPTPRERELEAALQAEREKSRAAGERERAAAAGRAAAEAVAFAQEQAGRLVPAQHRAVTDLYRVLAGPGADAAFADAAAGAGAGGVRPLDLLRELVRNGQEHHLLREAAPGRADASFSVLTASSGEEADRARARASAERYAEERNRVRREARDGTGNGNGQGR